MTFEADTQEPPRERIPDAAPCVREEPVGAVELRRAANTGRASFPQLFKAYWLAEKHGRYRKWDAEQQREAPCYRALYCALLPAFECAHGPIEMSYYADGMPGAVVLNRAEAGRPGRESDADSAPDADCAPATSDAPLAGDLHAIVWWEDLSFNTHAARTLFSDLMQLRDRVTSFIPGDGPPAKTSEIPGGGRGTSVVGGDVTRADKSQQERHHLLHELFCIACDLIASLNCEQVARDRQRAATARSDGRARPVSDAPDADPSPRHRAEIVDLRARLTVAEANYEAASKRLGQRWFLPGIRRGGMVAALVLVGFAVFSHWRGWDGVWAATAAAGVAGAIVSVLQRMTSGSLDVSAEADPQMVQTIGYCRIVLGVVLGVISYILVGGGLVGLAPSRGASALSFAGIAFIAGFSERFARDMLAAPTHLLDGVKGTKPSAPPSPSAAAH